MQKNWPPSTWINNSSGRLMRDNVRLSFSCFTGSLIIPLVLPSHTKLSSSMGGNCGAVDVGAQLEVRERIKYVYVYLNKFWPIWNSKAIRIFACSLCGPIYLLRFCSWLRRDNYNRLPSFDSGRPTNTTHRYASGLYFWVTLKSQPNIIVISCRGCDPCDCTKRLRKKRTWSPHVKNAM